MAIVFWKRAGAATISCKEDAFGPSYNVTLVQNKSLKDDDFALGLILRKDRMF